MNNQTEKQNNKISNKISKKRLKYNHIILISFITIIIVTSVFFGSQIKGYILQENLLDKKSTAITMGYCPTMLPEASALAEKYDYRLIEFSSALTVLHALNKKNIDLALIGRKAKKEEIKIPSITGAAILEYEKKGEEKISNQEYTLISKEKKMIDYSSLHLIEIHTYIPKETAEELLPEKTKIIYHTEKEEAIKEINNGKNVLIDWDDWQDEFELLLVMNSSEKVKKFRGVFLYKN